VQSLTYKKIGLAGRGAISLAVSESGRQAAFEQVNRARTSFGVVKDN